MTLPDHEGKGFGLPSQPCSDGALPILPAKSEPSAVFTSGHDGDGNPCVLRRGAYLDRKTAERTLAQFTTSGRASDWFAPTAREMAAQLRDALATAYQMEIAA